MSRTDSDGESLKYLERSQTEGALLQKQLDRNLTDFLNGMLVGYDKRIRPNNDGKSYGIHSIRNIFHDPVEIISRGRVIVLGNFGSGE